MSKFSPEGVLQAVWDQPVAGLYLHVPHKLFLSSPSSPSPRLFLADRENRRVISFDPALQTVEVFASSLPGRVFAVAGNSSSSSEWPLYGVFGKGKGFVLDQDGGVLRDWGPEEVTVCVCVLCVC